MMRKNNQTLKVNTKTLAIGTMVDSGGLHIYVNACGMDANASSNNASVNQVSMNTKLKVEGNIFQKALRLVGVDGRQELHATTFVVFVDIADPNKNDSIQKCLKEINLHRMQGDQLLLVTMKKEGTDLISDVSQDSDPKPLILRYLKDPDQYEIATLDRFENEVARRSKEIREWRSDYSGDTSKDFSADYTHAKEKLIAINIIQENIVALRKARNDKQGVSENEEAKLLDSLRDNAVVLEQRRGRGISAKFWSCVDRFLQFFNFTKSTIGITGVKISDSLFSQFKLKRPEASSKSEKVNDNKRNNTKK